MKRSIHGLALVFLLTACGGQGAPLSEAPAPVAARPHCGAYLADEGAKQAFKDDWTRRIVSATLGAGEAGAQDAQIAEVVGFFELMTLGYCQADGNLPLPYFDQGDDVINATLRETLVMDFVERLNKSFQSTTP